MREHSMRNKKQILRGDQTRCVANFYTVDHDLFAAANLLVNIDYRKRRKSRRRFASPDSAHSF